MTLFGVKVNSIATAVKRGVFCSLFVDDFVLYYRGANMNVIERQLQLRINGIHRWSVLNGFVIKLVSSFVGVLRPGGGERQVVGGKWQMAPGFLLHRHD